MTGSPRPGVQVQREAGRPLLAHHSVNVLVALLWAYFAYHNLLRLWSDPGLTGTNFVLASLFVRNSTITVLFLLRRPAEASSKRMNEWAAAILGTAICYFYTTKGAVALVPDLWQAPVYGLITVAGAFGIYAAASLGRSFGIVPANRGIKTTGLYAWVRHPIYASYLLFDLGFLLIRFSWLNLAIFATFLLAQNLRATYEERLLSQDEAYRAYLKKTKYRFIPGLI